MNILPEKLRLCGNDGLELGPVANGGRQPSTPRFEVDAAQARRLLAIAAVLDGSPREEAAEIGGMDRQNCGIG